MISHPQIAMLSFAHYHANFWTEAFLADGSATITCLWDDDAVRAQEAAARLGLRYEPDLTAALSDCDAVAICSETMHHVSLTHAACAAGRAILCEKPTARTVVELDAMHHDVAAAGVLFMQSFPKRFDPASHALKSLIDDGHLGRVHLVRIRHGHYYGLDQEFRTRWYVDAEKSGGGALLDEGVHGADMLNWFFGLPATVSAETISPVAGLATDETATALFRWKNGLMAELTSSMLLPAANSSIEIYGTKATALLSAVDLASRDITESGFLRVSTDEGGVKRWRTVDVTPRFKLGQFHQQNAIGFLHSLRTGERPPAGTQRGPCRPRDDRSCLSCSTHGSPAVRDAGPTWRNAAMIRAPLPGRLTPLARELGLTPLWGDVHNHCDLSYGHGRFEDALARAALQLDFVSITGHAHWPDMPVDEPSVAHIVAFHVEGFARLRERWPDHFAALAAASRNGFTVFPGYEIHSAACGDQTIVYRDLDPAPMILADSPAELKARTLRKAAEEGVFLPPPYRLSARGTRHQLGRL